MAAFDNKELARLRDETMAKLQGATDELEELTWWIGRIQAYGEMKQLSDRTGILGNINEVINGDMERFLGICGMERERALPMIRCDPRLQSY